MTPVQRYWDTDAFLGWLNQEADRFDICDGIISDAKRGMCHIVTSTITFAEVFWIRGPLTKAKQAEAIKSLFGYSWIVPAELDRPTAELARELLFTFQSDKLQPRDAVHLATAIRARSLGRVECFDTWDGGLHHIGTQLHRVEILRKKGSGADIRVGIPLGQSPLRLSGNAALPSTSSGPPSEQSPVAEPAKDSQPAPGRRAIRLTGLEPQRPGSSLGGLPPPQSEK